MKFMQPLISDNKNKNKKEDISDIKTIEEEQYFLCKLLHSINSTDPEILKLFLNYLFNLKIYFHMEVHYVKNSVYLA